MAGILSQEAPWPPSPWGSIQICSLCHLELAPCCYCSFPWFQMFVRLDELCQGPTGDVRWQEKARWIKFEEDVEEAAHRWGKPHLASISFRSVVDLRKCIKKGHWFFTANVSKPLSSDFHSIQLPQNLVKFRMTFCFHRCYFVGYWWGRLALNCSTCRGTVSFYWSIGAWIQEESLENSPPEAQVKLFILLLIIIITLPHTISCLHICRFTLLSLLYQLPKLTNLSDALIQLMLVPKHLNLIFWFWNKCLCRIYSDDDVDDVAR